MSRGITGDSYRNKAFSRNLTGLKEKINSRNTEISTSNRFQNNRDIGENLVAVKKLKIDIKNIEAHLKNNQSLVTLRLAATEQVLTNMMDIAKEFKARLVELNGIKKDSAPYLIIFKTALQNIESAANIRVGSTYLLGGTITNTPPIQTSNMPETIPADSDVDTSYYQGNNVRSPAVIGSSEKLDYQVLANTSGIEKLIRGIKIASDPSIRPFDERLKAAQTLVDEAISDLAVNLTTIGAHSDFLEKYIEGQKETLLYLVGSYQKITMLDDSEAITQLLLDKRNLEVAYKSYKEIARMNLADNI
jgi:flagellin-like hook-associated protein FlgL